MNFKIVTDTSCDLPKEIAQELNIEILPIVITIDNKQFLDGVDIDSDEVFEGMKNGLVYKTSQIPLNVYVDTFTKFAKQNIPMINVALSSGISSSFETSKMALNMVKEEYPDAKIYTLDSKCCSVELGIAAIYMAKAAKNGKSYEEIVEVLNFCKENTRVLFSVDDLKYLYRGGRISKTAAIIGGALNIKPILADNKDGKLEVIEKVRSKKKAINFMAEMFEKDMKNKEISDMNIIISHAHDLENVEILQKEIMGKLPVNKEQFSIFKTGSTIGAHTGPKSIYLFYLMNKVPENMYN